MARRIGYLIGSLSSTSINRRLAKALIGLAPDSLEFFEIGIRDLPLFTPDLEQDLPPTVSAFKRELESADGILFVSPEYNRSIPGALKNAIDWASRPLEGNPASIIAGFRGKVAGLMAASNSPFGGIRSVTHLRQILGTIQTVVVTEQVLLPAASAAFDESGKLKDALPAQLLAGMAARVVEMAERLQPPVTA